MGILPSLTESGLPANARTMMARPMDGHPTPGAAYRFVEGLHLRQWALRCVAPLAALATNGAGLVELGALPRHDAPGFPPWAETSLRITGAALVVGAAALRVAAKGVLVRKTSLTTGGAYGFVRHPFYLANLAGALGVFLLAGSLGAILGVLWLALSAPLYAVTIAGEESGLATLHPESFPAYAARVGALLPRGGSGPRADSGITWANLVAENEPPRLLRFLAGATAVFGLTLSAPAGYGVLALAALFYGASFGLPRARRAPRP
jgi:protein-S-isoprenylcysteine O-methyltransferase Ste14